VRLTHAADRSSAAPPHLGAFLAVPLRPAHGAVSSTVAGRRYVR
jgi:hypothetical protein